MAQWQVQAHGISLVLRPAMTGSSSAYAAEETRAPAAAAEAAAESWRNCRREASLLDPSGFCTAGPACCSSWLVLIELSSRVSARV